MSLLYLQFVHFHTRLRCSDERLHLPPSHKENLGAASSLIPPKSMARYTHLRCGFLIPLISPNSSVFALFLSMTTPRNPTKTQKI